MFLHPTHVHPSSVVVVVVVAMETLWSEWFSLQHPIVLIVSGEKFSLTTQEDTNTHTHSLGRFPFGCASNKKGGIDDQFSSFLFIITTTTTTSRPTTQHPLTRVCFTSTLCSYCCGFSYAQQQPPPPSSSAENQQLCKRGLKETMLQKKKKKQIRRMCSISTAEIHIPLFGTAAAVSLGTRTTTHLISSHTSWGGHWTRTRSLLWEKKWM